jgi:hypothetical protein
MMGGTRPFAQNFQGLDMMTIDSGENPLIASYMGAPHQVRGVDPAEYGRAAVASWGADASSLAAVPAGVVQAATPGLWDQFKTGFAGVMLALVLVAGGLAYIIWGQD